MALPGNGTSARKAPQVIWSGASLQHDTGVGHPESAWRIDAALDGARRAGIEPLRADALHEESDRLIAKVHSSRYQQSLDQAVRAGSRLFQSLDNPLSNGTYRAARAAVGVALSAAESIWAEGTLERAFIIARPPGHHAEKEKAMGFCFFNTIACVAERLRELPGIDRVFVFDWDVHHGNGTQHLFEMRDDVFYASMHRWPFYPGTGAADEMGEGRGVGATLNVPLPGGTGDARWLGEFETKITAAVDQFAPQAILISAGFDAHRRDPLGGMALSDSAYGEMTRTMVELANRFCEGRLLSLLEGGYDMEGLAASIEQHVAAL